MPATTMPRAWNLPHPIPDQAQHLALAHAEIDVVHRADDRGRLGEADPLGQTRGKIGALARNGGIRPSARRAAAALRRRSRGPSFHGMEQRYARPATSLNGGLLRKSRRPDAAAAKGATLRQRREARRHARDLLQPRPAAVATRHRPINPAGRDGVVATAHHRPGRSRDPPGIPHGDVVARRETTARSWVIQTSAVSRSATSFCTSARICAWMVTSSAASARRRMMKSG